MTATATNGKAHHAPPPPTTGSPAGDALANWMRSELARNPATVGFDLISHQSLRPDTAIQPFKAVELKHIHELASAIFQRATHEAQVARESATYIVVQRPDDARFALDIRRPEELSDPAREQYARMTDIASRTSIETAEIGRDLQLAWKAQRESEQAGSKILLEASLAVGKASAAGLQATITEQAKLISALMEERGDYMRRDLESARLLRELTSQQAEVEIAARREESHLRMQESVVGQFLPIIKTKVVDVLVKKGVIPEAAAMVLAGAPAPAPTAPATFSDPQLHAIRGFLTVVTEEEVFKMFGVLGEASKAALQALVVAMQGATAPPKGTP